MEWGVKTGRNARENGAKTHAKVPVTELVITPVSTLVSSSRDLRAPAKTGGTTFPP